MSTKRNRPRIDATGRNPDRVGTEGRYLSLRRSIWHSPQVSALTCNARALMIELLSMFNGLNNGTLFLSVKDATARLGFSNPLPASDAFHELESVGLITNTLVGSFRVKTGRGSMARAWRLNWLDKEGKRAGPDILASLDMAKLEPTQRRRLEKRQTALKKFVKNTVDEKFAVTDTVTRCVQTTDVTASAVTESVTWSSEIGGNACPAGVTDSAIHILHHGDRGLMPSDVMKSIGANESIALPFVRTPRPGQPLFCELIALRRSIHRPSRKSGAPNFRCEQCGDRLNGGRSGRRFCNETCRKRAEGRRRYGRAKTAA